MIPTIIGFGMMILATGIRIVNQRERGLIERLGRYNRFAEPGFYWIIPLVERMRKVNITEQMIDVEPQVIITKDKLNAKVDAQIYLRVKPDEQSVKASPRPDPAYDDVYSIHDVCREDAERIGYNYVKAEEIVGFWDVDENCYAMDKSGKVT